MEGNIVIKKTRNNREFLAININKEDIYKYLEELKEYLNISTYSIVREKKIKRDGDSFHITILPPHEMEKTNIKNIKGQYSFNLLGLGHIKNKVFFIVVESKELNSLRLNYKLPKLDFHITLGFLERDIHGVRKNKKTLLKKSSNFK